MTLEEKNARISELEVLVASLQQQLKVARENFVILQRRISNKWRDEYDHLEYEDRDR